MKSRGRRNFLRNTGIAGVTSMLGINPFLNISVSPGNKNPVSANGDITTEGNIKIYTDFINGGGIAKLVSTDPLTIRFQPHDEGGSGWSKVWFHFKIEGLIPNQQIRLELEKGDPAIQGTSSQIAFSYDAEMWGLTDTGKLADNGEFFVYTHTVRSERVWFAYNFPYTSHHAENLLIPQALKDQNTQVIELCKSRNKRSVKAIRLKQYNGQKKYGIWLQARAHAFESGSSWVIHYLALWLLSDNSLAISLRQCADITVVPIVDADGVFEGRTGKNASPYDHGRSWSEEDQYWPELDAIKSMVSENVEQDLMDLFLDIHGPGGGHHPFFIVPLEKDLPYKAQQTNRSAFFKALQAKPLDEKARLTQSMTHFHYSERSEEKHSLKKATPPQWVTQNAKPHTIAFTLEINMNTPMSTMEGYQAQARVLGEAIATYFTEGKHTK
ncbi:MAG: M14 family zinc carboxypeptidase [Bacteroidota bacterium]